MIATQTVSLVSAALEQAKNILSSLPTEFTFHNLSHTHQVVDAATELSDYQQLEEDQINTVVIAAWFNETGFAVKYDGHEEQSKSYAESFLVDNGASTEMIDMVLGCIEATKESQHPENELEKILCDACQYHLATEGYCESMSNLRQEWQWAYKRKITNDQWYFENINFLQQHRYQSAAGQQILEPRKQQNLQINLDCLDKLTTARSEPQ